MVADARLTRAAGLGRRRSAGLAADPRRLVTHVPVRVVWRAAAEAAGHRRRGGGRRRRRTPDRGLHADRVVLRLHDVAGGPVTGHELRLAPRVSAALAGRVGVTGPATGWRRRSCSRSPSTRSTSRGSGRSGRPSPATSTSLVHPTWRHRAARPAAARSRDLVPADGRAPAATQPHPPRRRRAARAGAGADRRRAGRGRDAASTPGRRRRSGCSPTPRATRRASARGRGATDGRRTTGQATMG